jgi:3-deoxy-manno-octulosonate cytidylyltransferase (CMP-KDO synthetase)
MKIIAVIPARIASTRFPAKLMQDLCGETIILRTFKATVATDLFDDVFVVTDSSLIFDEILSSGGKAIMSKKNHESGSDRIAEAIENIDCEIVVNVQGDEPFVDAETLRKLIDVFKTDFEKKIDLASLMHKIDSPVEIKNPNNVKVVVDQKDFALYFSRSVIPFDRDDQGFDNYMKHVGIYAFRKNALLDFYSQSMQNLEATEKLEQLRYLEYGKKIKMIETDFVGIGIDVPEDLEKARAKFLIDKK